LFAHFSKYADALVAGFVISLFAIPIGSRDKTIRGLSAHFSKYADALVTGFVISLFAIPIGSRDKTICGLPRQPLCTRYPPTSKKHGKGQAEDYGQFSHMRIMAKNVGDGQVGGETGNPSQLVTST
jgi:hypothetical protein